MAPTSIVVTQVQFTDQPKYGVRDFYRRIVGPISDFSEVPFVKILQCLSGFQMLDLNLFCNQIGHPI